jgi:AAA+ ATPase superfamily predicted ATPase
VYPYRSLIEEDKQETLMTTIDERLRIHYSSIFERVCRAAIWHFPEHFDRVGRWWHGEDEIDVVGVNEKEKIILLGECKWSKKVVGKDLLADLEQKSEKVNWKIGKRTERFVLFSKSGFTEELKDIADTRKNVELFTGEQIDSLLNRK